MNTYASSARFCAASGCKLVAAFMILALCTVTMAPSAWSQDSTAVSSSVANDGGNPSSAGLQAVAFLSNVVYFPVKAVFAISGGIVGGLTYVFSGGSDQAAKSVWITSLYGTYLLTPDHLQGNRPVRFLGVADANSGLEPVR